MLLSQYGDLCTGDIPTSRSCKLWYQVLGMFILQYCCGFNSHMHPVYDVQSQCCSSAYEQPECSRCFGLLTVACA